MLRKLEEPTEKNHVRFRRRRVQTLGPENYDKRRSRHAVRDFMKKPVLGVIYPSRSKRFEEHIMQSSTG
jgi:hypothetical protein